MSNHLIPQDYAADDGWNDAADEASERMIRGSLLKFADWRWTTGKEGTRVPDGTRLVALATAAAWNRWEDGKIAETRVRRPGERMPEREDLGYTDEDQWETNANDEAQDPWANTRYVYLVDLTPAAEVYTFATSSWGGREAVVELRDAMRTVRVDKNREVEVPVTWAEGENMITHALGGYYDGRGKNLARLSIAARVAHGLFGKQLMAADPTTALLYLVREICARKGAGLNKELAP